jgi:glycosyl transferase family 25
MISTPSSKSAPHDGLIDAIFVLSVRSFTDRIAHMTAQMAHHQLPVHWVFDYDVPDLTPDLIAQYMSPNWQTAGLTLAHISLILKNIAVWQITQYHQYRRILVFEDDVLLVPDFTNQLSLALSEANNFPSGWAIFLGGSDVKVPDYFFQGNSQLIAHPINTAEAIVSDLTAVQRRLAWIKQNRINLPADHLIRTIDREVNTPQYWVRQALVQQGSTTGLFYSFLDTHRQKHSRWFTALRYTWNRWRRQTLRRWWHRYF